MPFKFDPRSKVPRHDTMPPEVPGGQASRRQPDNVVPPGTGGIKPIPNFSPAPVPPSQTNANPLGASPVQQTDMRNFLMLLLSRMFGGGFR